MKSHATRDTGEFWITGPRDAPAMLLLAHGAGAPATSDFMEALAGEIAAAGLRIARFEFQYMAQRRKAGTRRPPPKAELLIEEFNATIKRATALLAGRQLLVIGGKSLGGRVASMVADHNYAAGLVRGLVCFGYPFHPPAKPTSLRTAHLAKLACPALIVQGEADAFGRRDEVETYPIDKRIAISWIPAADHDLKIKAAKALGTRTGLQQAAAAASAFITSLAI